MSTRTYMDHLSLNRPNSDTSVFWVMTPYTLVRQCQLFIASLGGQDMSRDDKICPDWDSTSGPLTPQPVALPTALPKPAVRLTSSSTGTTFFWMSSTSRHSYDHSDTTGHDRDHCSPCDVKHASVRHKPRFLAR